MKTRNMTEGNPIRLILAVALPMMIQNGISNFVNLLDNLMIGRVGTNALSGVGIANQLMFVFNLAIFGAIGSIKRIGKSLYSVLLSSFILS